MTWSLAAQAQDWLRFADARPAARSHAITDVVSHELNSLLSSFQVQSQLRPQVVFISYQQLRLRFPSLNPRIKSFYYRQQIYISTESVFSENRLSVRDLRRTIRHELAHFLVAETGGSYVPAWFDEGLAQDIAGRSASDCSQPGVLIVEDKAARASAKSEPENAIDQKLVNGYNSADYLKAFCRYIRLKEQLSFPGILRYLKWQKKRDIVGLQEFLNRR